VAAPLAETLIAALERRRASGEIVPASDAAASLAARLLEWRIERALLSADPVLVDLGVGPALAEEGIEVLGWPPGLGPRELLGLEGPERTCGVSVPSVAVAERGTLGIAASAGQGRSLDAAAAFHVAVLPEERIRRTLVEALAESYRGPSGTPSALSLVSAPSRTSDIEKVSTLGAHGALGLHAVVVASDDADR